MTYNGPMKPEAIAHHQHGVQLQQAGHLREAVAAYEAALTIDPSLELTRGNLAQALHQLGESDAAIQQYQQLLEAHPLNVKARFNLGVVYASLGQLDRAMGELRHVLSLEPGHAMALGTLAWLLQQQQRHGEALEVLQRLRALSPDDATVLNQLAVLHRALGEFEQAEACWLAVVQRDPRHLGALLALADLARAREDTDATLRWALDALEVEPSQPAAQIMAARSHMTLLEHTQAAERLLALAERLPQNAEVRYQLGKLAHERQDLHAARQQLAEACRLAPEWLEAQCEMGAVLYRLGLFDDAIDHYRVAESLSPDDPVIKANMGFAYLAIGEREAATTYFEAFQARPGGGEEVALAVQCALDLI